jgi:hypothetical protein
MVVPQLRNTQTSQISTDSLTGAQTTQRICLDSAWITPKKAILVTAIPENIHERLVFSYSYICLPEGYGFPSIVIQTRCETMVGVPMTAPR